MLEIKSLYSGYEGVDVIKNINVIVNHGENLCIIGPNGCGKSTLLKSISNLIEYRGSIKLDSKDIKDFSRKELAKKIALMGQISQIYFSYSVYETVSLGRYAYSRGILGSLNKEDKEIIDDSLKKVGLYNIKDKLITDLSGGQLQRVFLARTLAQDPEVILLDEPTNHLDLKHQIELLEYLIEWSKINNKIVIGVLHDLNLVQYFSDSVVIMNNGEMICHGKAKEVLNRDTLKEVYDIDIKKFMLESLSKWSETK